MDDKIRILISAHLESDREIISAALTEQGNFNIVGLEQGNFNAMFRTELLKPDVLIIDIQFTIAETSNLARVILARSPSTKIIIFSHIDDVELIKHTFNAGISAFLLKEEDLDKIALVVNIVHKGGSYISDPINRKIIKQMSFFEKFPVHRDSIKYEIYTPAERCIVTAMASGYSDEDIADDLNLSPGTIKNCLTSIRKKIKLKSRIEIVIFSLTYGLIRLENMNSWKGKLEALAKEFDKEEKN